MEQYLEGPETDRLLHRALIPKDAPFLYRLNSDPDVMKFTCEPRLTSVEEAERLIRDYPDFDEFGYGRWGTVLKETGELVGFCGLKYLTSLERVDVGYRFVPEVWGKGLATEACTACVQFGLSSIGLSEIIGLVRRENLASIRVLEKAGLQFSGEILVEEVQALLFCTSTEPSN